MSNSTQPAAELLDGPARALGAIAQGAYVIGSVTADGEGHLTASRQIMHVAADPLLVAVCLPADSTAIPGITDTGVFTVNVISRGDSMPASAISGTVAARDDGSDKITFRPETGCPILREARAWLECRIRMTVPVNDHILIIGRVLAGNVQEQDNTPGRTLVRPGITDGRRQLK